MWVGSNSDRRVVDGKMRPKDAVRKQFSGDGQLKGTMVRDGCLSKLYWRMESDVPFTFKLSSSMS